MSSNAIAVTYRRGDMIEKRREMMADWEKFLTGNSPAKTEMVQE